MDGVLMFRLLAFAFAACISTTAVNADDQAHGKDLFTAKCTICHTVNQGGPNKLGPNLFGIVGRHSASLANFNYSPAMRGANVIWGDDTLRTYLAGPQKMIPGSRMAFAGFSNPSDARDVVAYLQTQK